jgi:rhomboid protease GluP
MCPHCRAFITTSDRVCPYCGERVGPRAIELRDPGALLGGLVPGGLYLSALILTINVGLYLLCIVASMKAGNGRALMDLDQKTLALFGAKYRPLIFAGQWWRLITAGFLHAGTLHIVMNSFGLLQMGPQVEMYYGTRRMVVIYFSSTVLGFLASTFVSGSFSVGASAGLFGLLGALLAITLRHEGRAVETMRSSFLTVIGILVFGFMSPFIDNAAHIGGLIAGTLVGLAAGRPKLLSNHPVERFWQVLAGCCILLTALAYFQWFTWYRAFTAVN